MQMATFPCPARDFIHPLISPRKMDKRPDRVSLECTRKLTLRKTHTYSYSLPLSFSVKEIFLFSAYFTSDRANRSHLPFVPKYLRKTKEFRNISLFSSERRYRPTAICNPIDFFIILLGKSCRCWNAIFAGLYYFFPPYVFPYLISFIISLSRRVTGIRSINGIHRSKDTLRNSCNSDNFSRWTFLHHCSGLILRSRETMGVVKLSTIRKWPLCTP